MSKDSFDLIDKFGKDLPQIISRKEFCEKMGGLISPRTLANMDSKGKGPGTKVRIGRTVGYTKESVIQWLSERIIIEH